MRPIKSAPTKRSSGLATLPSEARLFTLFSHFAAALVANMSTCWRGFGGRLVNFAPLKFFLFSCGAKLGEFRPIVPAQVV